VSDATVILVTAAGVFETRWDGKRLSARVNGGPWSWTVASASSEREAAWERGEITRAEYEAPLPGTPGTVAFGGSHCASREQTWPPAPRTSEAQPDADAARGWYRKYEVTRLNDAAGKHTDCEYFVLDLVHDAHAPAALRAYAESCATTHPQLSKELAQRFGLRTGEARPGVDQLDLAEAHIRAALAYTEGRLVAKSACITATNDLNAALEYIAASRRERDPLDPTKGGP
jgi:hypothetical protein